MKLILASALWLCFASNAFAFDEERFQSGMTRDQLATELGFQGLSLWEFNQGLFAVRLGKDKKPDMNGPYINLSFCQERLVSVLHNIQFDSDFVPLLDRMIGKYGNLQKVTIRTDPWGGDGGGYIQHVYMTWYQGDDRIQLSFNPEARNSDGSIKATRSAAIGYAF